MTYVECICGKKFEIDRAQVEQFDCEGCGRNLRVPSAEVEQRLQAIRQRSQGGEPGMRDAMQQAADLRDFHAVPILKTGAESGMRESVNIALTGLADFPGPGHDVLKDWIKRGALSMSRLVSALREQKFERGSDFICDLIDAGALKENQIAEVAPYLGDTGDLRALEVLREARRKFPNMGGLLDSAMSRMKRLDESAGTIPDEAKRIPGRAAVDAEPEAKKGCMGLLVALALAFGMIAALAWYAAL
jgi:hypothetical protein